MSCLSIDRRHEQPRRLSRRRVCSRLALTLLLLLAAEGCEIHDEQVQSEDRAAQRRLLRTSPGNAPLGGVHTRQSTIEYVEGYVAGQERAAATGKPLLVICRAAWCRWCAGLSQGVLADPEVIARSGQCVCVTLDADRDADVCERLSVRAFPTVILQSPQGREIARLQGRSQVRGLAAAIDDATARVAVEPVTTLTR